MPAIAVTPPDTPYAAIISGVLAPCAPRPLPRNASGVAYVKRSAKATKVITNKATLSTRLRRATAIDRVRFVFKGAWTVLKGDEANLCKCNYLLRLRSSDAETEVFEIDTHVVLVQWPADFTAIVEATAWFQHAPSTWRVGVGGYMMSAACSMPLVRTSFRDCHGGCLPGA